VFEVRVTITGSDTTLRPGMTTGNVIETLLLSDVLSIPIEALDNADGISYVYKRTGGRVIRQEVTSGPMNDDAVVIEQGLVVGDEVLLTRPRDGAALPLVRLVAKPAVPGGVGGDTAVRSTITQLRDTIPPGGPPRDSATRGRN
jgi:hypothetical protein